MSVRKRHVLYVDIDGTVRRGPQEIGRPILVAADVEVYPEVPGLLQGYKDRGWRIIGLHNAGELALGTMTWRQLEENLTATYERCGLAFDKISICQHHPEAEDPEFARCWCRKPRIGLIVDAAAELAQVHNEMYPPHMSLLVGDGIEDRICAENANIDFMLAEDWRAGEQ